MQGKASAPQHCESALTYCTLDAFFFLLFFSLVPAVVSGKHHETPVLSCRYAVVLYGQWAWLLFWYKCLLLVKRTAVINVLLTGSRMWIIFLTGRASLILRPPAVGSRDQGQNLYISFKHNTNFCDCHLTGTLREEFVWENNNRATFASFFCCRFHPAPVFSKWSRSCVSARMKQI